MWDLSTLHQLAAYSAAGPVQSICFSTTDDLALYGTDTSVGAIELETGGACLRHIGTVNPGALLNSGVFVAAHPDGKRLITASEDGLVRLWPLPRLGKEAPYPFLIMSPGAIQEFWLFLHCGAADREAALAARPGEFDEAVRRQLLWEIDALKRLLVAFGDVTRPSWGRNPIDEDTWFYTVVRRYPLDEVGVALLSDCLDRQKQFWAGKVAVGGDRAEEAAVRLQVIEAAHELFHERLGLSRQAVERRCEDLWVFGSLWDGGRSRNQDVTAFGKVLVSGDEAPITPEELKERMDAARQQTEASSAEGSHEQ